MVGVATGNEDLGLGGVVRILLEHYTYLIFVLTIIMATGWLGFDSLYSHPWHLRSYGCFRSALTVYNH